MLLALACRIEIGKRDDRNSCDPFSGLSTKLASEDAHVVQAGYTLQLLRGFSALRVYCAWLLYYGAGICAYYRSYP